MNFIRRLRRGNGIAGSASHGSTHHRPGSLSPSHWRSAGIALFAAAAAASSALASDTSSLQPAVTALPSAPAVAVPTDVTSRPLAAAQRTTIAAEYGHLPLYFEKNQGQTAAAVQYLARGAGYSLFLAGDEAVLSLSSNNSSRAGASRQSRFRRDTPALRNASTDKTPQAEPTRKTSNPSGTVIRAQLLGANKTAVAEGEAPLPGRSNYFIGNDPAKWHADILQYAQVRYHQVYNGIDLVYYGNQQQLEYDFVVAPGADPQTIKLRYSGVSSASVDARGDLHLRSGDGEVVEHKPLVYQVRDAQREPVTGAFRLIRHDGQATEVAFAVADYDKTRPLVIDPALVYSTYLGGSLSDYGYGVAVDSGGAAYVTGYTASSDFPTTSGAFNQSGSTNFISKLSADGSSLVYSTYLGGSGDTYVGNQGYGIAVDSSGVAYVTGYTRSTDFPVTSGAFQTSLKGTYNAFVVKLSANGGSLYYSTYLGGSGDTSVEAQGIGIAVDSSGEAFVSGGTESSDFPVTSGAFQVSLNGTSNVFVTKLHANGRSLVYSTYLGGSSFDGGDGIAVDSSGNAYVTGYTSSSNFPTTSGAFQTSLMGFPNAFITKLHTNGSSLVYSTYLGGSSSDESCGIAIDSSGAAYVTGYTGSSNFPTTSGAFQIHLAGSYDAFVSKLSANGHSLVYSTFLGGSNYEESYGIAVDNSGAAYVTGRTASSDFPTTSGALQTHLSGSYDAFVSKLHVNGSSLVYSSYLGGSDYAASYGIAVDNNGAAYVTGYTNSSDFPTTGGAFQVAYHNSGDAFVSKLVPITATPVALSFGNQAPGSTSTAKVVTLKNGSDATLTIASIATGTALFAQTDSCGSSLVAGTNCTVNVTFSPTLAGAVSDTLTIGTSGPWGLSSFTVALSGKGTGPAVSLSPTSQDFGNHKVGTTSSARSVHLTNNGTTTLTIDSIVANSPYAQTNTCGSSVAAGANCSISISFSPVATGSANGSLTITSNALSSPDSIPLSGNGT